MYLTGTYLTLDVETTNLDFGNAAVKDNRHLLCCWKRDWEHYPNILWGSEYELGPVLQAIKEVDFIIAHNAKMELKWLYRAGLDLSQVLVYDTMVGEYQIAGNRRVELSLGALAPKYGAGSKDPYVDGMLEAGVCPSELPPSFVQARCLKDVLQTEAIFVRQRRTLQETGKLAVQYTACLLTPALAEMEMHGMALDERRVHVLYRWYSRQYERLTKEIDEFSGGVNFNSPKQMQKYVYETLGFEPLKVRGQPKLSADADTLDKLAAKTPEQRRFKALKSRQAELHAALTKTIAKFEECVNNKDVLHGLFNQCVTGTHRLSSSGTKYKVQFQNLDRKFKKIIRAKNSGWKIGEADGSQLEFRVAAYLGQDTVAYDSIMSGEDVHAFTRSTLLGAGHNFGTTDPDEQRNLAKPHTFKPLYGGQSGTKAERAYYTAFREKYPGVTGAQERWKHTVLQRKSLRQQTGLEFFWPDTRMDHSGYITNGTQICNYPVQYLATGEIIPIAVVYLWHRMRAHGLRSYLINTVHDSAIAELHPDEDELWKKLAVQAFTKDVYSYLDRVYNIQFNVPLGVGLKIGSHWSKGKETKLQVEPPYERPK